MKYGKILMVFVFTGLLFCGCEPGKKEPPLYFKLTDEFQKSYLQKEMPSFVQVVDYQMTGMTVANVDKSENINYDLQFTARFKMGRDMAGDYKNEKLHSLYQLEKFLLGAQVWRFKKGDVVAIQGTMRLVDFNTYGYLLENIDALDQRSGKPVALRAPWKRGEN